MMQTDLNNKCPFHANKTPLPAAPPKVKNYTAHFENPPERGWLASFTAKIKENFSRISYSSLRNAWRTYSLKDLNKVFGMACKEGEFISDFHSPVGTQYIVKDPVILQLIASQYRNEENGLFCVPENEKLFIDLIIKDLYPNELAGVTDREKEVVNAILFTAESAHVHHLRTRIMGFLKQKSVQDYKWQIDKIAEELFDQLSADEKLSCDPAALVFEFAITVICKLFMGYHATRGEYQKIVRALVCIGKYISYGILHQPPTSLDKAEYATSLQTMRKLLDENVAANAPLALSLNENGFSSFASRLYMFFFYLAGTETTSAVTHYLVLQLGRKENRHYQEIIKEEGSQSLLLKKCIVEALRLHPPAYIMGRALRKDMMIVLKEPNGSILWKKRLLKGHYIVNWIGGAGRNPRLYSDPNAFHPLRFDTVPAHLPWLPFSSGHHVCPGQFLARAEMESFMTEILKRYKLENIPDTADIETQGTFTLHADPAGKIKIKLI